MVWSLIFRFTGETTPQKKKNPVPADLRRILRLGQYFYCLGQGKKNGINIRKHKTVLSRALAGRYRPVPVTNSSGSFPLLRFEISIRARYRFPCFVIIFLFGEEAGNLENISNKVRLPGGSSASVLYD